MEFAPMDQDVGSAATPSRLAARDTLIQSSAARDTTGMVNGMNTPTCGIIRERRHDGLSYERWAVQAAAVDGVGSIGLGPSPRDRLGWISK